MRFTVPCLTATLLLACAPLGMRAAEPAPPPASAGEDEPAGALLSDEQIQKALQPHSTTRSFTPRGLARADQVSHSVSLNIQFERNSSVLRPQAAAQLHQLELALGSAALRGERFEVAGHTDAQGSAPYNKELSLRRAETVKRYLVAHGIDAGRLETVGYGSERLLSPDQPYDARNRRVEIRDLGATTP